MFSSEIRSSVLNLFEEKSSFSIRVPYAWAFWWGAANKKSGWLAILVCSCYETVGDEPQGLGSEGWQLPCGT